MTSTKRNILLIAAAIMAVGLFLTQCTYIPTAPTDDFATAALDCSAAIGPTKVNVQLLEANGWKKLDTSSGSVRYERSDIKVRLILKEGLSGCLIYGFAESDDQFPQIKRAIGSAFKAAYGKQFTVLESVAPNEQSYETGDLFHMLSAQKTSEGFMVKVASIWNQEQK